MGKLKSQPLKLQNKLDDILWSLEMIKRQSQSEKGCTLKDTGSFIADGQVDDLIDMIKEHKKHKIQFMTEQDKISNKTEKSKEFDEYWNEKSMRKNE